MTEKILLGLLLVVVLLCVAIVTIRALRLLYVYVKTLRKGDSISRNFLNAFFSDVSRDDEVPRLRWRKFVFQIVAVVVFTIIAISFLVLFGPLKDGF